MEASSTNVRHPIRRDLVALVAIAVAGNGFVAYLICTAATPGRRERTSGVFAGVALGCPLAFAGWRWRDRVAAAVAVGASLLLSALLLFLLPDRAIEGAWWEVSSDEWNCPPGFEIQPF
jgi:peptidoglycan/LPS O-acetylase OafA/YrhL